MREWSPGTCLGRTGVASGHCVSGKQLQSGKTPAPVPNLPTPGLLLVKLAQCFLVLQLWDPVPAVLLSRHTSTASWMSEHTVLLGWPAVVQLSVLVPQAC